MPLSSVLGAQSLVRPGVCTSSTRPASPFEGQVIYETDTDKIMSYSGSAWQFVSVPQTNDLVWQTWTPTYTNMTAGNGTVTARYCQLGKVVFCSFNIDFGSTSTMGTNPKISLPVTASSSGNNLLIGLTQIHDSGTAYYNGCVKQDSTTTAVFQVTLADGNYARDRDINSTVPMTWTTNDGVSARFHYEAA